MKNERGITIVALGAMIIILAILLAITINYGVNSYDAAKLQNFSYELQQVQGKVDAIHEKILLDEWEYLEMGNNITASEDAMNTFYNVKNVDYNNISEEEWNKYYYDNYENLTKYRYIPEETLRKELNISSEPGDMIINFETREVISVKGFKYKNYTFYTLEQMKETN